MDPELLHAEPAHASLGAWLLSQLSVPPSGLWPFWLGGIGLAAVAVAFPLLLGRSFGVSSAVARALDPVRERALDRLEDTPRDEPPAVRTRLSLPRAAPQARDTWAANVVFVVSVPIGGAVAALSHGAWGRSSYGGVYETLVAPGPLGLLALFAGGLLVGFGTQLSGGCTSGHGLVGCARAQGPSLTATAFFFGTAVAVSLLLSWVRS